MRVMVRRPGIMATAVLAGAALAAAAPAAAAQAVAAGPGTVSVPCGINALVTAINAANSGALPR